MRYIFLFLMCIYPAITHAKITLTFTPNPVAMGNSVEMTLTSDQPFQDVPNLEILQKDFLIGGQQQRQSSQWINGKGSTLYELSYTLFPHNTGTLTVDGLRVGTEVVPAGTLTVNPKTNEQTKGNVDLVVQCAKQAVYPGQKTLCDISLIDSIGLVDGTLIPPSTDQGKWEEVLPITPAGGSPGYQRYRASYTFSAKNSGKIEMPPFIFQGAAFLNTRPKRNYNSFIDLLALTFQGTATKPVSISSNPVVITIKDKPTDYNGWWLHLIHYNRAFRKSYSCHHFSSRALWCIRRFNGKTSL